MAADLAVDGEVLSSVARALLAAGERISELAASTVEVAACIEDERLRHALLEAGRSWDREQNRVGREFSRVGSALAAATSRLEGVDAQLAAAVPLISATGPMFALGL